MTRTLAIGDIHGCYQAFCFLLDLLQLSPDDRLVTLGDYVDRGPDSALVVAKLIELSAYQQHIVCLKGNHEAMMLDSRNGLRPMRRWALAGGNNTCHSYEREYPDRGDAPECVPQDHWQFLQGCRHWLETENHIFVHACCDGRLPLIDNPERVLLWDSFEAIIPKPGKTVVCGHTPQPGHPVAQRGKICIDSFAWKTGWLTCLDTETNVYYQAHEDGSTRIGELKTEPKPHL